MTVFTIAYWVLIAYVICMWLFCIVAFGPVERNWRKSGPWTSWGWLQVAGLLMTLSLMWPYWAYRWVLIWKKERCASTR